MPGMTDTASTPERPARPKRGAFPTPKSEIDEAQPYVPDDEAQPYVPDGDEPAESVDGEPTSAEVQGEAER